MLLVQRWPSEERREVCPRDIAEIEWACKTVEMRYKCAQSKSPVKTGPVQLVVAQAGLNQMPFLLRPSSSCVAELRTTDGLLGTNSRLVK